MNCDLWRSHGRIFAHWTSVFTFNCACGSTFCVRHLYVKTKKLFKTIFFV